MASKVCQVKKRKKNGLKYHKNDPYSIYVHIYYLLFRCFYLKQFINEEHHKMFTRTSQRNTHSIAENEIRKQTRNSERLYTIFQVF